MEFFKDLLNFIFPARCFICHGLLDINEGLCEKCLQKIKFVSEPFCSKCGKPFKTKETFEGVLDPVCLDCRDKKIFFEYARSLGNYEGVLRQCIHLLKYRGKKVILKKIDNIVEDLIGDLFCLEKISFVLPVPLHKKRFQERGFNQSTLIANLIGDSYSIPVIEEMLERISFSRPQVALGKKERIKNIKNVFKASTSPWIKNSIILLVDDVYTTGSTVNECARILKKAGASKVYVFTLAHGR